MKTCQPHTSSIGDAHANWIAVACYLALISMWTFSLVIILAVFLVEKKSGLVKFHSMQALLLWVCRYLCGGGLTFEAIAAVLTQNPVYLQNSYGWEGEPQVIVLRGIVGVLIIAASLLGAVHANKWQAWRVPIIGQFAAAMCKGGERTLYFGGEDVPVECMFDADRKEYEAAIQKSEAEASAASARYTRQGSYGDEAAGVAQLRPAEDAVALMPTENLAKAEVTADKPVPDEGALVGHKIAVAKPVSQKQSKARRIKGIRVKAAIEEPAVGDPNMQLPQDMRDDSRIFMSLDGYESNAQTGNDIWADKSVIHAAEVVSRPEPKEGIETLKEEKRITQDAGIGQVEPVVQKQVQAQPRQTGGVLQGLLAKKVFGKVMQPVFAASGLGTGTAGQDPNEQIPPDMRDSMPYVDMLDAPPPDGMF